VKIRVSFEGREKNAIRLYAIYVTRQLTAETQTADEPPIDRGKRQTQGR
jgi:hypothetical protein